MFNLKQIYTCFQQPVPGESVQTSLPGGEGLSRRTNISSYYITSTTTIIQGGVRGHLQTLQIQTSQGIINYQYQISENRRHKLINISTLNSTVNATHVKRDSMPTACHIYMINEIRVTSS